ncbi:MAG: hypothetical protein WD397_05650, partial [Wenzhouxiangellaceae bacterium]
RKKSLASASAAGGETAFEFEVEVEVEAEFGFKEAARTRPGRVPPTYGVPPQSRIRNPQPTPGPENAIEKDCASVQSS